MSNKFDFKTLETGFAADWPVNVSIPLDGGKVETQTFMARFKTPTPAEQAQIEALDGQYAAQLKLALQIGFPDLAAAEGQSLTPAMFEQMWGTQNVQIALIKAYQAFQQGAPAKN